MLDRVKTDIRLSSFLSKKVGDVCSILGISKNAFYTLSISLSLVVLSPILRETLRKDVKEIKGTIKDLIEWSRNSA